MASTVAIFWTPGPIEIILVFLIALLLFGKRLPDVARSLGKGISEFKKGVKDIEEDSLDPDDVTPLRQIIQAIDDELDSLEKRRARLLYIRNLALGASQNALEEMDRRKKQVVHHIVDQGPTSVEVLSRTFQLQEDRIRDIVSELEKEGLVVTRKEGRKKVYSLTERGRAGAIKACEYFCRAYGEIFREYGPEEIQQVRG